jgi:hypothetical protein
MLLSDYLRCSGGLAKQATGRKLVVCALCTHRPGGASRLKVEEKQKLADERVNSIQEKFEAATHREEYFRNISTRYSQAWSKLAPIINNLQENPGITADGYI